ncbi:hypothetical protein BBO99_00009744 [Phytophthora kernoviae]|uniref:C2H2-type domain-containing protein n=2 Tax=Phytophthora kernoviae TaxID=325452 RepID=A0A3R7KEB9_9STRA|nr:hypothetical protein BBO99_00009744 [Phytophthora kernoviae]
MQASINIDLISGDGERVGGSIFSLSYLFFSEERYCCSEEPCEDTFRTEAETEAHWFEVHGESTLPETGVGAEAYAHSYRSCYINIPIVSTDAKSDQSTQASRRVGSIHVSAYLEDLGVLTKKHALLKESMYLADAEKRAKQVESDFAEYRQQQRKVPESKLREEIAALKGSVAELEKQKMVQERACEIAETNVEKMKFQLEQMAKEVKDEKKKHEARVVDELEKLRVKYIAREEKYVLDGDRDELRAIKKQLDDLKGINFRGASGAYDTESYLVQELDRLISITRANIEHQSS